MSRLRAVTLVLHRRHGNLFASPSRQPQVADRVPPITLRAACSSRKEMCCDDGDGPQGSLRATGCPFA